MIDADKLTDLMKHYGLGVEALASGTGRSFETVRRWLEGEGSIPPYIELTIIAVTQGAIPATPDHMSKIRNLHMVLGVPYGSAKYWKLTNQFPMAARLAIAALGVPRSKPKPTPNTLVQYDRQLLANINRGRYFRVTGGWRSRPVMGKQLPKLRKSTPDRLLALGMIRIDGAEIKLTDAGRREVYKNS